MTPDPEIPARYRGGNRPLIGQCDHFTLKQKTGTDSFPEMNPDL
jgi:hypothetical protein